MDHLRSGVQDQPGHHGETPSLKKKNNKWLCWEYDRHPRLERLGDDLGAPPYFIKDMEGATIAFMYGS